MPAANTITEGISKRQSIGSDCAWSGETDCVSLRVVSLRSTLLFSSDGTPGCMDSSCCAAPEKESAELDDWLVRNEKMNKSFIARGGEKTPGAKLAKLIYTHLKDTERYSLIEVQLLTGRHHQIRCQLAGIGCVIKGDLKYGAPRSNPDGGICLHSHEIKFVHPVKKEEMDIIAPPPVSWKLG